MSNNSAQLHKVSCLHKFFYFSDVCVGVYGGGGVELKGQITGPGLARVASMSVQPLGQLSGCQYRPSADSFFKSFHSRVSRQAWCTKTCCEKIFPTNLLHHTRNTFIIVGNSGVTMQCDITWHDGNS